MSLAQGELFDLLKQAKLTLNWFAINWSREERRGGFFVVYSKSHPVWSFIMSSTAQWDIRLESQSQGLCWCTVANHRKMSILIFVLPNCWQQNYQQSIINLFLVPINNSHIREKKTDTRTVNNEREGSIYTLMLSLLNSAKVQTLFLFSHKHAGLAVIYPPWWKT